MTKHVKEEQIAYAKLLDWGMKIGLLLLIVTFIIYLTGILPPQIPISELPKYWKLKAHEYLASAGISPGWAWLNMVTKGDFFKLCSCSISWCYNNYLLYKNSPYFSQK